MQKVTSFVLVTATIILGLTSCSSRSPQRLSLLTPPAELPKDWSEIFQQPPSIDSFKILNTGSVKVPVSGMLNIEKLPQDHPFEDQIWVDVFAFLFHHRDRGWFLIDSGLDQSFQRKGNIMGLLAKKYIKQSRQEPGQNIGHQLAREKKHIQGIYLTHLHGDHTAGLPEIDPTIPKYVGAGDKHYDIPLLYRSNHFSSSDTLREIPWRDGHNIPPLAKVVDLFGDGSFFGIHSPGHSQHHLSYLLVTEEGPILLTGDASHTRYGFKNGIEPGWADDRQLAENSLSQLRSFANQFQEIQVIYGHQQ